MWNLIGRVIGSAGGLLALSGAVNADEFDARYRAIVEARGAMPETARLHALFDVDWAYAMASSPETATYVGVAGHERRWTDWTPAAVAARKAGTRRPLEVLATIDRAALGAADRLNHDLFKRLAEEAAEGARFPGELLPITQLSGIQQDAAQILSAMPAETTAELEDQLARLHALPAAIDEVIALLRDGVERGVTPPRVTLRDVPAQVANQIPDDPWSSPLLRGFADLPRTIPGEDGLRLRNEAGHVYTAEVKPAFERLRAYLVQHYIPRARETTAMSALPEGEAWYRHQIKTMTSTSLTAREIHAIGLAEVARLRAEMERVKAAAGFDGTLEAFFVHLRTDPRFYFTDRDALLRAYRDIAKRADPLLTRFFKTLPRTPYGVLPVPDYAEQSQTTAYYYPGSPEAGRPGYFFANTYALETRPRWEMEALTLHEAVPGHHLQISLAQELGDVPEFRKWSGYTAFVEGWGLYAEHLEAVMNFRRRSF